MRGATRLAVLAACAAGYLTFTATAAADHATRPHTQNMHALGHSPDFGSFELPDGQRDANSDLAFWGNLVFHGDYDGFRIVRRSPGNPKEISRARCNGDQGDLVVWGDILVRSWNSPAPAGRTCDGDPVPTGFEGVHIFDISNLSNPQLVDSLALPCGSHTATLAGVSGGNLIVYSNISSSAGCVAADDSQEGDLGDFMDVIAVDLETKDATLLRREPLAGPQTVGFPGAPDRPATGIRTGCHDVGVIRGDVNLAACASADTINVWDIGNAGGTLEDPLLLHTISEPGVGFFPANGRWHSATFTWDGEVLAAGWEPGGGGAAECEATDPDVDKSMFFYDAQTGAKLGQWVLPRAQGADENCTIHNYNVVPLRSGRYVAVGGHYQAGTWVVDFTNPASPDTLGWSDPPSLGPGSFCGGMCQIGGAWSSYWYNNFIYESDITKGLNVFRFSGRETGGAIRLPHLNPQTQEFSLSGSPPGQGIGKGRASAPGQAKAKGKPAK